MTTAKELLRILKEELKGYEGLYELLKKEKEAIISFRPSDLEDIVKEKDTLVLQLRLLDEERKRLVQEYARANSCGKSLVDIYNHTGNKEFLEIRSELISLLQAIEELNEINRIFIERATLHLKTSSTFLKSIVNPESYTRAVSREV
ncbi:MAG: flagellar protein FlgN [Nitrospirae bacterium]|nr:flagellar protein FlgN [Nitrospirota bacterium]